MPQNGVKSAATEQDNSLAFAETQIYSSIALQRTKLPQLKSNRHFEPTVNRSKST
jgi:hypothetical protein